MDFVLVVVFSLAYNTGVSAVQIDTHYPNLEACQKAGSIVSKAYETTNRFVCIPAVAKENEL